MQTCQISLHLMWVGFFHFYKGTCLFLKSIKREREGYFILCLVSITLFIKRNNRRRPQQFKPSNKTSHDTLNRSMGTVVFRTFLCLKRIQLYFFNEKQNILRYFKTSSQAHCTFDNAKILLPCYLLLILSLIGKHPCNCFPTVISSFPSLICLIMLL